jgi:hypothetical protein
MILFQWISLLTNGFDINSGLLKVQKINECTDVHTMIDLVNMDYILQRKKPYNVFYTSVPLSLCILIGLLATRFAALEIMSRNQLRAGAEDEEKTGRDGIEINIASDKKKLPHQANTPRSKARTQKKIGSSHKKSDSTMPVMQES